MKKCLLLLFSTYSMYVNAGCLDGVALTQLEQTETAYMSSKIPPAFKYGVIAGEIQITVLPDETKAACGAILKVTVPAADIQEANSVLDAQPAKKIMLAAQGYSVPEQTSNEASFSVDPSTLKVTDADYLQTAALGKLRASLELMYAFITQKRAAIQTDQQNTEAWPAEIKTAVLDTCTKKQTQAQCECMVDEYAKKIPSKQMEYIESINSNPYAIATGANTGFDALKKQALQTCAG